MDSRASERFERSGTVVDPRQSLAMWLRAGRARRQLSLDEVARVTKIQPRILEKLESGRFDGLPAEVFVKGFVRSVARCLGLDEAEALARYGECVAPGTAKARAFVEVMAPAPAPVPRIIAPPEPEPEPVAVVAAPVAAVAAPEPVIAAAAAEDAAPAAPAPSGGKKKRRRGGKNRKKRATETHVAAAAPADDAQVAEPVIAEGSGRIAAPAEEIPAASDACDPAPSASEAAPVASDAPVAPWKPTMPPLPASSPPWRRPALATMAPSLVIDDEDPDRAEREQEARSTAARDQRVSFLPPILLDRDRGGQGGLTLAVIILLIAATLTLSYLMRRPSVRGDGVTMTHATPVEMV